MGAGCAAEPLLGMGQMGCRPAMSDQPGNALRWGLAHPEGCAQDNFAVSESQVSG